MNKYQLNIHLTSIRLAWQSLVVYRGRSILTIMGIAIGIAAVIIVMSAGESIKGLVLGEIDAFGANTIQIEPKVPTTGRNSTDNATTMAQGVQINTLTLEDAEAIAKLPNVWRYSTGVIGQGVVSSFGEQQTVNYIGTSPEYVEIDRSEVAAGRFFTADEDNELARVAVLGSGVAEKLFGSQDPIGQDIKIGRTRLIVIGVLDERGAGFGVSFDDFVYVPVRTVQQLMLGIDHISWVTVQVTDPAIQDQTAEDILILLRERHDTDNEYDDDFSVTTLSEARDLVANVFGGITLLLIAVAGISLLVGGVGIMNIMYVSVTERTFEIGLRKAVGARPRNILWQFLWEAIMVTFCGGVIGVIIGFVITILISFLASAFGFDWSLSLPPQAVLVSIAFCGMVGLVFGFYPARRAALMDPIEALRYEQ